MSISFFNPLKVIDQLELESLEWVHRDELGEARLDFFFHPFEYQFYIYMYVWKINYLMSIVSA